MNYFSQEFEEVYNDLPCGYHSLDRNENFVRINDVELQMLGYSREEVIGRNFAEFLTSESLPTFQQNFPVFKQRGWVNDLEFQMRCKDGTILPISLSATAIKDSAGNFLMSNWVVVEIGDRQQAQEALRESEEKLHAFVSATSDIVYEMSADWQEMVSLKGKDFIATTENPRRDWMKEYIPETDKAQVWATINRAIATRSSFELTHRVIRLNGTVGWTFSRAIPLMNETGEIVKWFGTAKDITEQKQAELILQQQVSREHLLAEITQGIHQTLKIDVILHSAIDRLRRFLQTDRVLIFRFNSYWLGKVVSESVASEYTSILESEIYDPCFTEKYVQPYRQGRVSWVSDFHSSEVEPCYRELMAQFQVRANLVVPILQQKHLWGLLIAHHCRAPREWFAEEIELFQQLATQFGIAIQQADLYQKNAEQAALIDIASDAIFVRDLSNRILFWSQGAERMYGWQAAEVRGRIAHELFYRESPSQLQIGLSTTIKSGNWYGEFKQVTKSGREIIVSSRWTLMRDQRGDPQSILVVNTDITEKKQLEQQLLHAQRLESIGTLAGGIAHDFNNILTPILGFTQLLPLHIPNLDESSMEMLELIRANALRGADIIKQILMFSRDTETQWELVSISQLLEEILKLIRQTFAKSIVIEDYIKPGLWLCQGDSSQLHQLLINLCVNARDAMPDGGKLIISADNLSIDEQYSATNFKIEVGNYILIAITDTGMGIPPEIIERIFEPFFTTKEPGKGTGLGLSTAIGIVKNHGGQIEVQSDRRNGTQFQIYLPAAEEIATTETISDETIPSGRGELILVVDDEAAIREVIKATLETYNYRVITASDGLDAIAIYAQQPQEIQVVLMDLVMPEMDGLTAMGVLKKINPHVKLIATSGTATKEKISAAESIGIKSFLVKPYTAENLLFDLNQIL